MAGSYIITNKSQQKPNLTDLLNCVSRNTSTQNIKATNNPDLYEIDLEEGKRSIGISEVKKGIKFLDEKPFQEKNRFLIIYNADRLTVEAQNSILKTLEEPPEYALIILVVKTAGSLLETINSRCRKLNLTTTTSKKTEKQFTNILNLPLGERLGIAEELSKEEKDTVIKYLNELAESILADRNKKNADPAQTAVQLEKIQKRIIEIDSTNVTLKLALEELLLNL